jgi:ATP-dependent DNA ligase
MEGVRYLEDGRLTIFKRDGSYYARIRPTASARYLGRSLKTTSEQTAIDLGRRLPGFIKPQLATLKPRVPTGKGRIHEIKYDDYPGFGNTRMNSTPGT